MKCAILIFLLSTMPLCAMEEGEYALSAAIRLQNINDVKELLPRQRTLNEMNFNIRAAKEAYDQTTLLNDFKTPVIQIGLGLSGLGAAALCYNGEESREFNPLILAGGLAASITALFGTFTSLPLAVIDSWSLYHNTTAEERAEKQKTAQTILDMVTKKRDAYLFGQDQRIDLCEATNKNQ